MNTALDNVMAQAEAAAAAHQVPEVPAYQPPALQQPGGVPAKRTLQSVNDNAGILVETYLLPKTEGLKIGNDMQSLSGEVLGSDPMTDVVRSEESGAGKG